MSELEGQFEIYYQEYYEKLFRTAFRLTGNREDAQDVIQEAYINAYRSFSQFNHTSSFGTWIYKIMLNCAYRYMTKRDKLPIQIITAERGISETEFWESLKSQESVEEQAMVEDIRETCLQLFLNCIPKKQRIAFTLKILMELPSSEVADIMGISESAVKINVYRAKQHLKNNIEEKCSFINPENPCQCGNWVKYLIDTGKVDLIPADNPVRRRSTAEMSLIWTEMDFLRKIIRLYDHQPGHTSYLEFRKKIREIIVQQSLKILT
ncbi:RNA polymerase sigma factor, sigma-70 family [Desulfosporosinus orientis DSM 765]|uniref:RNA polymerase sigma factor n=1 Tax=Desulfosporosinus orientis (strain ATCC 19365 / DSM 765 / NCIMB 8382 / VKM B-1628 / Singapore I) TaxID=768706 RepID=G7WIX3_DESOD|nr:sigma-70 family RNA polymerase sigma factor [Desulfosporosinus orientis]AET69698.1 RNA polymerase sigma factor, sigma-70 family [Desulfosporosinus orientis DSM 765]